MREFNIKSDLAIEPSVFWSTTSMRSVNWELWPIVRMTSPKEWQNRPIDSWEGGVELFKSWILLFGLIPIDRHSFRLRNTPKGFRFNECSSSLDEQRMESPPHHSRARSWMHRQRSSGLFESDSVGLRLPDTDLHARLLASPPPSQKTVLEGRLSRAGAFAVGWSRENSRLDIGFVV
jgi:hypothetical protein